MYQRLNALPPKAIPKSANKDTLPMHNIPFDSHWSAYLRIDISSYEGGSHFERNCFRINSKVYQPSTILGIIPTTALSAYM